MAIIKDANQADKKSNELNDEAKFYMETALITEQLSRIYSSNNTANQSVNSGAEQPFINDKEFSDIHKRWREILISSNPLNCKGNRAPYKSLLITAYCLRANIDTYMNKHHIGLENAPIRGNSNSLSQNKPHVFIIRPPN